MFADAVPLLRLPKGLGTFTYRVPTSLAPRVHRGAYVRIPFRKRQVWGIVTRTHDHSPAGVRATAIRDIRALLPDLTLTDTEVRQIERLAMTTGDSLATVAYLLLPVPPARSVAAAPASAAVRASRIPPAAWATDAASITGDTVAIFHTHPQRMDAIRAFTAAVLRRGRSVSVITPHRVEVDAMSRALADGKPPVTMGTAGGMHAAWQAALAARQPRTVSIATRVGAPFAPDTLGGIIVDLADADGHKQWDAEPRYDARGVTAAIAHELGIPRLLLSVAPRLEEWAHARRRIDLGQPPENGLDIIDLTVTWRSGARGYLTDALVEAIRAAAEQRRGVVILHNRRGRAARLTCRDCHRTVNCPRCEQPLAEDARGLRCRTCAAHSEVPAACPSCESPLVIGHGIGTVRIAELLRERFPDLHIARVDRDDPAPPPRDANITIGSERFLASVAPQVIGPVGLVVILHAERFVRTDDFRADERLLQALRGARAWARTWSARLVVQTTNPDSPPIHALTGPLTAFYRNELEVRRTIGFPPATRLIALDAPTSTDHRAIEDIRRLIERAARGTLRGLGEPTAVRVGRQSRQRITLRLDPGVSDDILAAIAATVPPTWVVDPDPIDLM